MTEMWRRATPYWFLAAVLFAVTSPLMRNLTSGGTFWEWQLRWFNLPILISAIATALLAEIKRNWVTNALASAIMFACFAIESRFILIALVYPFAWTAAGAFSAIFFAVAGIRFALTSRSHRQYGRNNAETEIPK
ncbi:hypothetical protein L1080_033655 [Rhodococcus sp. MSC1_016]|uniref:hypothetical protein n=1 Tax=Rhodococcus sp. MSC1_016 TaxID=2909266 RepID=UPI002030D1DC|nr:hypothetical protein [Rhodococcus sp. MSC1_016]